MSSFSASLGHSQSSSSRHTDRSATRTHLSGLSSIPPIYELMYIEMSNSFERLRRRKLSPRSEETQTQRNNQEFLGKMRVVLSNESSPATSPSSTPSTSLLCSSSSPPSSPARSQPSSRVSKSRKRREGIKVIPMHNGSIQASFKLDDRSSEMYMGTIRQRKAAVSHASTSMISYVNPVHVSPSESREEEEGSVPPTNVRQ